MCEEKRLDTTDASVWKGGYIPAGGSIFEEEEEETGEEEDDSDEGQENDNDPQTEVGEGVRFTHIMLRMYTANEPLLGNGLLPDWLRNKTSIYSLNRFDDNLCFWRCMVIFRRLQERKEEDRIRVDAT